MNWPLATVLATALPMMAAFIIAICRTEGIVPVASEHPHNTCDHKGAVRVESYVDPDLTLAWWCAACETRLAETSTPPIDHEGLWVSWARATENHDYLKAELNRLKAQAQRGANE